MSDRQTLLNIVRDYQPRDIEELRARVRAREADRLQRIKEVQKAWVDNETSLAYTVGTLVELGYSSDQAWAWVARN